MLGRRWGRAGVLRRLWGRARVMGMLLGMPFGVATGVCGVGNEVGEGLERSLDRSGTSLGSGEGAGTSLGSDEGAGTSLGSGEGNGDALACHLGLRQG